MVSFQFLVAANFSSQWVNKQESLLATKFKKECSNLWHTAERKVSTHCYKFGHWRYQSPPVAGSNSFKQ